MAVVCEEEDVVDCKGIGVVLRLNHKGIRPINADLNIEEVILFHMKLPESEHCGKLRDVAWIGILEWVSRIGASRYASDLIVCKILLVEEVCIEDHDTQVEMVDKRGDGCRGGDQNIVVSGISDLNFYGKVVDPIRGG